MPMTPARRRELMKACRIDPWQLLLGVYDSGPPDPHDGDDDEEPIPATAASVLSSGRGLGAAVVPSVRGLGIGASGTAKVSAGKRHVAPQQAGLKSPPPKPPRRPGIHPLTGQKMAPVTLPPPPVVPPPPPPAPIGIDDEIPRSMTIPQIDQQLEVIGFEVELIQRRLAEPLSPDANYEEDWQRLKLEKRQLRLIERWHNLRARKSALFMRHVDSTAMNKAQAEAAERERKWLFGG